MKTARCSCSTTARSSTTSGTAPRTRVAWPQVPGRARTRRSFSRRTSNGGRVRKPLQRDVGIRALGRATAETVLLARPLRHQALRLPVGRPPPRIRERAAGTARRSRTRAAADIPPSATSWNRVTQTTSTRPSSRRSPAPRPVIRSRSTTGAFNCSAGWQLKPAAAPGNPVEAFRELLRRFGATTAPHRRGTRHRPFRRTRLVGRRRRHRPPLAHRRRRGAAGRERQQTFTVVLRRRGHDERPYADAVVRTIRSRPHWMTFTDRDLLEIAPRRLFARRASRSARRALSPSGS